MDALDFFDIRDAYDAMDDEKLGISMEDSYTIYLGLGYPKTTLETLRSQVMAVQGDASRITVETLLSVLSRVSKVDCSMKQKKCFQRHLNTNASKKQYSRGRNQELSACFSLVDIERKGFISANDIKRLAEQSGESLTKTDAETILAYSTKTTGKMSEQCFQDLFSPPSP